MIFDHTDGEVYLAPGVEIDPARFPENRRHHAISQGVTRGTLAGTSDAVSIAASIAGFVV